VIAVAERASSVVRSRFASYSHALPRRGLILVLAAIGLAGCGASTTTATSAPAPASSTGAHHRAKPPHHHRKQTAVPAPRAVAGSAAAALAKLPVKGRAPKTGYSRTQFGDGWGHTGGCDTRDRILTRDLTARTYLDACHVGSGMLVDPYTARPIHYVRGASEVDIDHVVALSDGWQKGAQQWSPATREAFANDPLELLAVDARVNRAKGDGDAATWLPDNKPFRCSYVARQVAVKVKYQLWVTQAEKDAIGRVLATCPRQKLPAPGAPIHLTPPRTPTASATTPVQPAPSPAPASPGTPNKPVSEVNCSDFATHAAAQGWFTAHGGSAVNDVAGLDGNHDGTACQDLP
jgi:hypothetical protein